MSQHSDHVEVSGIKVFFFRSKDPGQEHEHNAGTGQSANQGDDQSDHRPDAGKARQQIAGSAKPGQESGGRNRIQERKLNTVRAAMTSGSMADVHVWASVHVTSAKPVRRMPMESAQQERKETEGESQHKAHQVEVCPGHLFIASCCYQELSHQRFLDLFSDFSLELVPRLFPELAPDRFLGLLPELALPRDAALPTISQP